MAEEKAKANETTQLWEDWEKCRVYQSSIGLSTNLPKFVKFYEGDHWPAPTENTKNLPRPVVNLIKMICRNKKSAILSTPVKIIYSAADQEADVESFNRFAEYIQRELGQEALDKKAIHDGTVKGPYVYHYYWDADARGMDGRHEGALRGEIIDPLNIGFANPEERDEQKQKWILIRSREDVSSVRAGADHGVDPDDICADSERENPYGSTEQDSDKICTVLTRYFRKNGEVYYEKATKNTMVSKARPLAPDVKAARQELGYEDEEKGPDAPNNSLPDSTEGDVVIPSTAKAPLYPVAVGSYEPREQSIYGIGEVQGLIPNQKAINFMLAMSLLNAQEIAWGKYVVTPDALRNQKISNIPGQVLIDYSKTGGGIRKMTEQTVQSIPVQLVDTLTSLTRTVTGSGEVMTGETISAGMSGAAIAQLQSQALLPVEELKESFWLVKAKQGKIMAQFFKLFYHDAPFRYKAKTQARVPGGLDALLGAMGGLPMGQLPQGAGDPMAQQHPFEATMPNAGGMAPMPGYSEGDLGAKEEWMPGIFEGSDYENVDFEVTVEATSGTKASAAGDIAMLELLLSRNIITPKTFLNAYPKDALSNKSEILRGMEEDEQDQLRQISGENEQLRQQLAQCEAAMAEQAETVEKVQAIINENLALKGVVAQIYNEANEKMAYANQIIAAERAALEETTADAHDMAKVLMDQSMAKGQVPMGGAVNAGQIIRQ